MAVTPKYVPATLQDIIACIQQGLLDAALTARGFTGAGAAPNALSDGSVNVVFVAPTNKLGLYGASPVAQQAVAGATIPAALASLLAKLVLVGLATDTTTPFTPAVITGTLPQEQIDSIVAGLVALGFATDGR